MKIKTWADWRFFHRGDDFFDEVIARAREARSSIQVETYIFEDDALTSKLLEELGRARERGCQVRLLVDGFGSYYWLNTLRDRCQGLGLELRVWQPLPRSFSSLRSLLWRTRFRLIRIFRYANRRNHRKIVLIDEKIAFIGSQNWTQIHSERIMGPKAWRDSGVELRGEDIASLAHSMKLAWHRASPKRLKIPFRGLKDKSYFPKTSLIRLNQNARARRQLAADLLRRIKKADRRILITSAYFLPTRRQWVALKKAAKRGVEVAVILPDISDVPVVKWAAFDLMNSLTAAGVKIHEYRQSVLHAKYLIIDQWAALGSTNFNHRSFFHDLEVEAAFTSAEAVGELARQWEEDRNHSQLRASLRFGSLPFWKRSLFHLAFRWRYLL